MTTVKGLKKALAIVKSADKDTYISLHGSLPCTGGTPWWYIMIIKSFGAARLQAAHRASMEKMLANFNIIARAVLARKGVVSFEWPDGCSYWLLEVVQYVTKQLNLHQVVCHGCVLGFKSKYGKPEFRGLPHFKPFRIASTSQNKLDGFKVHQCPNTLTGAGAGTGDVHKHAPVQGRDTSESGRYTPEFCEVWHAADRLDAAAFYAQVQPAMPLTLAEEELLCEKCDAENTVQRLQMIIDAKKKCKQRDCQCVASEKADNLYNQYQEQWDKQKAFFAAACKPEVADDLSPEQFQMRILVEDMLATQNQHVAQHREHYQPQPLWSAMVTKTLHPGDPLCRSDRAKLALESELHRLRSIQTWDEMDVYEKDRAKELFPNGHFARIFAIFGIKNFEFDESQQKYKARVVFGGEAIKDASDEFVVFGDVGTTPSNMTTARACMGISCLFPNMRRLQSDCIAAFTQALMSEEFPTFVSLPRQWWPKHWHDRGFKNPVCRLRRALYGHPRSGDLWHQHLHRVLTRHQFRCVEGWPSIYYRTFSTGVGADAGIEKTELAIILVYVDDLLIFGSSVIDPVIAEIRTEIDMEDLAPLTKYLGCTHQVVVSGKLTYVTVEMQSYFNSALQIYKDTTKLKVNPAATPFVSDLPQEQFIKNVTTPGKWGSKASSFLMKLLYGARIAFPIIAKAITSLASQISKWSLEADRRLHRIYEFLAYASDFALQGCLSIEDLNNVVIAAYPDADLGGDVWSARSTTGYWVELKGADGRSFPLAWSARFQTATSLHTCESETVALTDVMKKELLPLQSLISTLLQRDVPAEIHEDNQACIISIQKGFSPAMRYIGRTHQISLEFLHEICFPQPETLLQHFPRNPDLAVKLLKVETDKQKGDLFTKDLSRVRFMQCCLMIGMLSPRQRAQSLVACIAKEAGAQNCNDLMALICRIQNSQSHFG